MPGRDWQRVLNGVVLVLQEGARQQIPEVTQRTNAVNAHAADLLRRAAAFPSTVMAARSNTTPSFTSSPIVADADVDRPHPPSHVDISAVAAAAGIVPREGAGLRAGDAVPTSPFVSSTITKTSSFTPPKQALVEPFGITREDRAKAGVAAVSSSASTAGAVRREAVEPMLEVKQGAGRSVATSSSSPLSPSSSTTSTPPFSSRVAPMTGTATPPPLATPSSTTPSPATTTTTTAHTPREVLEEAKEAAAQQHGAIVRRKRQFREVAVPASPLARVWGFGTMAAGLAFGAAGEAITGTFGYGPRAAAARAGGGDGNSSSSTTTASAINISEAQAERLAEGLCRMRGAALKIGQMLSLSDETMIPPQIAKVLERVRTQADVMPKRQLEKVMTAELGPDWRARLGGENFSESPVAAASIGQVHRATLPDGREVAVKVQYPGVAESIDSDLDNLRRLLLLANFLPKGLYLDSLIDVAREELGNECNYEREAECQERFRSLVGSDPDFEVPSVVKELSTKRVLVTTWLRGQPIDAVSEGAGGSVSGLAGSPGPMASQPIRDAIARKLLKLTLRELFEWRFMQTDPNWGNFFYDTDRDIVGLLDFGAAREFPKPFVDDYLRLVWAAANGDRDTIKDVSVRLGFLTGYESKVMLDAHIDSGMVVGEPFRSHEPFDFRGSNITARVGKHGAVFAEQRLTPPPPEVYSLHRKLAGAFLICIRMGAVMPCRDMLEETYRNYKFG